MLSKGIQTQEVLQALLYGGCSGETKKEVRRCGGVQLVGQGYILSGNQGPRQA